MPMTDEPSGDTMNVSAVSRIKIGETLYDEPGQLTLFAICFQVSFISSTAYIRHSGIGPNKLSFQGHEPVEGCPVQGLPGTGWHPVSQGMKIQLGDEDHVVCSIEGGILTPQWVGPNDPTRAVANPAPATVPIQPARCTQSQAEVQPAEVEKIPEDRIQALLARIRRARQEERARQQGQQSSSRRITSRSSTSAQRKTNRPPASHTPTARTTRIAALTALHRTIQVPHQPVEEIAISLSQSGDAQLGFKPRSPLYLSLGLTTEGMPFAVLECAAEARLNKIKMVQGKLYEMRARDIQTQQGGDRITLEGATFEISLSQARAEQGGTVLYTMNIVRSQS